MPTKTMDKDTNTSAYALCIDDEIKCNGGGASKGTEGTSLLQPWGKTDVDIVFETGSSATSVTSLDVERHIFRVSSMIPLCFSSASPTCKNIN